MWAETAVQAVHLLLLRGLVVVGGSYCIGGDSEVLLGAPWHPSRLLSPPVGEAVRHLQWSKLPSAVFACLVTRDASSLCHSP